MSEFGPTVSRLQSNVQGLQEETETCQRAAAELREKRDSLQRRVQEADTQLAERRAALNQFQFKLKSQGLLVDDCEKRAKGGAICSLLGNHVPIGPMTIEGYVGLLNQIPKSSLTTGLKLTEHQGVSYFTELSLYYSTDSFFKLTLFLGGGE